MNLSRFFIGPSLAIVLLTLSAGLTQRASAGKDPAPSAQGDATSTGVITPSLSNTVEPGSVSPNIQQSLNQTGISISQDPSIGNLTLDSIIGPTISTNQITAARGALDTATAISNRRNELAFAPVRGIVLEYGGSAETAELTVSLLNGLMSSTGQSPSIATTKAIVELTLNIQGLITQQQVQVQQLLSSITAFNQLINQLTPEQLVSATAISELLELKDILETLAGEARS